MLEVENAAAVRESQGTPEVREAPPVRSPDEGSCEERSGEDSLVSGPRPPKEPVIIEDEVIDQIWDEYDADGSGDLDKEETRRFVAEVAGEEFDEEAFVRLFDEFDDDKSGTIEKGEMKQFISALLNSG